MLGQTVAAEYTLLPYFGRALLLGARGWLGGSGRGGDANFAAGELS